jgi:hypothetical protein
MLRKSKGQSQGSRFYLADSTRNILEWMIKMIKRLGFICFVGNRMVGTRGWRQEEGKKGREKPITGL